MSIIKNILTIEVPIEFYPTKWDVWWNNLLKNNREHEKVSVQGFRMAIQNHVFSHMYFRYSFETAYYRMVYFLKYECIF